MENTGIILRDDGKYQLPITGKILELSVQQITSLGIQSMRFIDKKEFISGIISSDIDKLLALHDLAYKNPQERLKFN